MNAAAGPPEAAGSGTRPAPPPGLRGGAGGGAGGRRRRAEPSRPPTVTGSRRLAQARWPACRPARRPGGPTPPTWPNAYVPSACPHPAPWKAPLCTSTQHLDLYVDGRKVPSLSQHRHRPGGRVRPTAHPRPQWRHPCRVAHRAHLHPRGVLRRVGGAVHPQLPRRLLRRWRPAAAAVRQRPGLPGRPHHPGSWRPTRSWWSPSARPPSCPPRSRPPTSSHPASRQRGEAAGPAAAGQLRRLRRGPWRRADLGGRRGARASRSTWRARSRRSPSPPRPPPGSGMPVSRPKRRISTCRSRCGRAARTSSRASRPTASTASSSAPRRCRPPGSPGGRRVVPDRGVQAGDGLGGVLEPVHLLGRHVELDGQLLIGGFAAQQLMHAGLRAAAGPPAHRHGPGVGWPGRRGRRPPGRWPGGSTRYGVGGELEPLAPVELLHRPQQAQAVSLDQSPRGSPVAEKRRAMETTRRRLTLIILRRAHSPWSATASSHGGRGHQRRCRRA